LNCATKTIAYKIEKTTLISLEELDETEDNMNMPPVFDLVPEEDLRYGLNCPVKVEFADKDKVDEYGLAVSPVGVVHGNKGSKYLIFTTTKEGRTRVLRSIHAKQIKYHVNEAHIKARSQQKKHPLVSEKPNENGGLKNASIQRDTSGPSTSKMLSILPPAVDPLSSLHNNQSEFPQGNVLEKSANSLVLDSQQEDHLMSEKPTKNGGLKNASISRDMASHRTSKTTCKRKALALKDTNNADQNHCDKKQCTTDDRPFTLSLVIPKWVLKRKLNILGTLEASKWDIVAKAKGFVTIKTGSDGLAVCIVSNDNDGVGIIYREVTKLLVSCLYGDGSTGRLLYELAKSGTGRYMIPSSPSGLVKQRSIFDADGDVWMHLVEIPYLLYKTKKDELNIWLRNIRSRYPQTQIHLGVSKYCAPYALVYGLDIIKVVHARLEVIRLVDAHKCQS
jgi:hypothetical protein